MKFDPRFFLKIANRSGVELTLKSNGRVRITSNGKPVSGLWLVTAKKHKAKLLRHLKDEQERPQQIDLFADNSLTG